MNESDSSRSQDDMLREFLRDRDVACPHCGYNLRNLEQANCPECGNTLRVTLQGSRLNGAWLIGATIPPAVGLFVAVTMFVVMTLFTNGSFDEIAIAFSVAAVDALTLVLLAVYAGRFLAASRLHQAGWVGTIWLVHACALIVLTVGG